MEKEVHICTGNPKQVWCYDDPSPDGGNIHTEITEAEILDRFYPYWVNYMLRLGKQELITQANCIDDYIIMNWAYPKQYEKVHS